MSQSTLVALILALLLAMVASSSSGYLIGSNQLQEFQSSEVAIGETVTIASTITVRPSGPSAARDRYP